MTNTETDEPPFCEAAAEWDHLWHVDATGVERCSECGVLPYGGAW
jgi:hypothetical protein